MPFNENWQKEGIWGRIGLVGTVFGALVTISTAVAMTGFDMDRPVWLSEHKQLKEVVYQFGADYYHDQLNNLLARRTDLRLEKYKFEQARKPAPDFLIQELEQLEIQIEDLKEKIRQAEQDAEAAA